MPSTIMDLLGQSVSYQNLFYSFSDDCEMTVLVEYCGARSLIRKTIADMEREMVEAADALEFERAAMLRDEIRELQRLVETLEKPGGVVASPADAKKKMTYPMVGGRGKRPAAAGRGKASTTPNNT